MKKEIKENVIFLIIIVVCIILASISTAYAAILFSSSDVKYDNTTSGLNATNVQTAIDELYTKGTNYTTLKSRTTTLETSFNNLGTVYEGTNNYKTVSKNTWYYVSYVPSSGSLPAGYYTLNGYAEFGTPTGSLTEWRFVKISTNSDCSDSTGITGSERVQIGNRSSDESTVIVNVNPTSATKYYLCVYTNYSTTSITVKGLITAIRSK